MIPNVAWSLPAFRGRPTWLAEPVGGSILGYLVFGEVPGPLVLAGATVLLAGVAGAVWGER